MTNIKIEEGLKVYQIAYWEDGKRTIEKRTINKVYKKSVMFTGSNYRMKKLLIGREWFLSIEDAIKDAIYLNEKESEKYKHLADIYKTEADKLKKRLSQINSKNVTYEKIPKTIKRDV